MHGLTGKKVHQMDHVPYFPRPFIKTEKSCLPLFRRQQHSFLSFLILPIYSTAKRVKESLSLVPSMILYCDNENYLTSLQAVRERCFKVQQIANKNQLNYFDVDINKMDDVVQFVVSLIKRDYNANPAKMPTHGQWRHFDVGGRPRVQNLINVWSAQGQTPLEQTRRIIDLFIIACLLDVESVCHNKSWSYSEQITGRTFGGTEGVAVAVLDMFTAGVFSSDVTDPHRVDGK